MALYTCTFPVAFTLLKLSMMYVNSPALYMRWPKTNDWNQFTANGNDANERGANRSNVKLFNSSECNVHHQLEVMI